MANEFFHHRYVILFYHTVWYIVVLYQEVFLKAVPIVSKDGMHAVLAHFLLC